MPEAGEILQGRVVAGTYHLGRHLGGTARSAVFFTERTQSRLPAVVKLIPADSQTADLQLSRWRVMARLNHPHLLQVFDVGRSRQDGEEVLYAVMEYGEENLAEVLANRPLTPDEAREMLEPMLETLAYLHGRGFVHGHLKPSNIMMTGGNLKLSCDGLWRIGEPGSAGDDIYAPPEGPGTPAGPAWDIWSLGLVIVQSATQLLPARNRSGQRMVLPEALPEQYVELAQNCLEPDPKRRCTLAEIAEHLHFSLPSRTLGPPAPPVPEKPSAPQRQVSEIAPPAAPLRPVSEIAEKPRAPQRQVSEIGAKPAAPQRQASQVAARPTPPLPQRKGAFWPVAALILAGLAVAGGVRYFRSQPDQPAAETAAVSDAGQSQAASAAPEGQAIPRVAPQAARAEPRRQVAPPAKPQAASEVRNAAPAAAAGALVPGTVVEQVLPDVPRSASNTIHGTVRVTVRVRVDARGSVLGVSFVSAGPSRYFSRLASDAARKWKFTPAQRGGQPVVSSWTVRFEFTRLGRRAIPTVAP
jgi:TonB family protein